MKSLATTLVGLGLAAAVCSLSGRRAAAEEIYSETFDSEEEAKIEANIGAGMSVAYVDYGAMLVGATEHSIPEAPRRIPGSAPTKGILCKTVYYIDEMDPSAGITDIYTRITNLVALDAPGGSRIYLEDNYRLKFDAYLRLSPNVTISASGFPNEAGTTEQLLWGVGYNQSTLMGRGWRTNGSSGMWGLLSTEGGFGYNPANNAGSDATLWRKGTLIGARNLGTGLADMASYFTPAFGADAAPVPSAPANQWVQVDITVSGKRVTVEYGAVGRTMTKFHENEAGTIIEGEGDEATEISFIAGGLMVGYEDAAASASFDPDNQWLLIDNIVIEDLTPPSLVVQQVAPLPTYTGTPTTATYLVTNGRATGDLTVTDVTFAGANTDAFSLATTLPLVIPAGQSGNVTVRFAPSEPDGLKSAEVTIVTNDAAQPNYPAGTLSARRSVGTFLMAHYKLDETAGATIANAVTGGPNGGLQIRDPLAYGQPSLLGNGSAGTALGFTPANSSTTGNYFSTNITNTPTYSISLWAKPAASSADRTLFQRHPSYASPPDLLYALVLGPDNLLRYRVNTADALTAETPIEDGAVSHIVITHLDEDGFGNASASRLRLYVNGALAAELTGEGTPGFDDYPLNATVTSLHIGSRTAAGFGYAGDLDDIQIYGAELTAEQVASLYQNPGTTAADPPVVPPMALAITGLAYTGDPARFAITFTSGVNSTYTLLRSPDLKTWSPVITSAPGQAGTTTLEDTTPPADFQYYKVERD